MWKDLFGFYFKIKFWNQSPEKNPVKIRGLWSKMDIRITEIIEANNSIYPY